MVVRLVAAALPADPRDARTDRELVFAARAGDTGAFDSLFYRYRDGIYRLGVAITRDPSHAEEIVVDTFTRAYRALSRLDPESTLRPWLYRVALNLSYNRKPRPGLVITSLDDPAVAALVAEETSPGPLAELAELRSVVLSCIEQLRPNHKAVVVLHYLNSLNLAEIAEVVACPIGTVKSRLHYALGKLRTHLLAHPAAIIEPSRSIRATR